MEVDRIGRVSYDSALLGEGEGGFAINNNGND